MNTSSFVIAALGAAIIISVALNEPYTETIDSEMIGSEMISSGMIAGDLQIPGTKKQLRRQCYNIYYSD